LTLTTQLVLALICHMVGDYVLQTDAMAQRKTRDSLWCAFHALTYGMVFLVVRPSPAALVVVIVTHFLIDRFRLARYVIAVKNATTDPANARAFFASPTGYLAETPPWMAVWLFIACDNTLHVAINAAALMFLR
jgi:Protein of unknown function (DUF3307)